MMLNRPKFWNEKNLLTKSLTPFSIIYYLMFTLKQKFTSKQKALIPVICVGNLTAGGAGKTPVAISIARYLISKGIKPNFIVRGYKGKLKGPVLVSKKHSAIDVGDEAILLSEIAPTWVSKNKFEAAKKSYANGADIIIMDDGLQNHTIYKDFSILVIDGGYGFGNKKLLPAGPLRETISGGSKNIDLIININDPLKNTELDLSNFSCPKLNADSELVLDKLEIQNNFFAFCGIGRPSKFFNSLQKNNLKMSHKKSFPDHHLYSEDDLMKIIETSSQSQSTPLTTKKDWSRLPDSAKLMVKYVDMKIKFTDMPKLENNFNRIVTLCKKNDDKKN